MNKLLVIGSLNMDMVLDVPSLPRAGETLMGELRGYNPGGKGANQAYAAGRLGADVAMIGRIGADAFGQSLLQNLREAGVDTHGIGVCECSSGLAVISVAADGENSITVIPGANARCDTAYIQAHEAELSDSLVVLLQMEIPHEAVYAAIRLAKRHGCTVVLNPAPAPNALPEDICPLIDYLCPNETELARLSGLPVQTVEDAAQAAKTLLARGVGAVLATLGSKGAVLVTQDRTLHVPGFPVRAVDTTAAGDTFCAAFCTKLAEGEEMEDTLRFANAAAAIAVTREGAQASVPDVREVRDFLSGRAGQ